MLGDFNIITIFNFKYTKLNYLVLITILGIKIFRQ